MSVKRTFYILLGLVVLLICAILGSAYGINSLLSNQSQKLVSLKAKVSGLNSELISLNGAKKDISNYANLYEIAQSVVPENKDQAETVRQIVNLAAANGVSLDSITFPTSTLGGSATTPSGTAGVVSTSNGKLSQLVAVPKIPGVYSLEITIASATEASELATFPQLIGFLQSLENNRQTALVDSLDIQPNPENHNLFSFLVTLEIYIKPAG